MESSHQLSFRPDCNKTAEVPSFNLRTALSAIPFVSDLCGVDVQYSRRDLHKLCQSPRNWQCKLLWVSYLAPRTFASSLVFLEKFVLHGYDWIHWVAKSCTTTAKWWLFRDSHFFTENLVICCYQVTKIFSTRYGSANASSARGPCRNFGLEGNEYKYCASPNPHIL